MPGQIHHGCDGISIHTPLARSDSLSLCSFLFVDGYFNPHSPCEE